MEEAQVAHAIQTNPFLAASISQSIRGDFTQGLHPPASAVTGDDGLGDPGTHPPNAAEHSPDSISGIPNTPIR